MAKDLNDNNGKCTMSADDNKKLEENTILTGSSSGSDNRYLKIISSQYYGRYIKVIANLIEDEELFDAKMTLENFLHLVLENTNNKKKRMAKEGE